MGAVRVHLELKTVGIIEREEPPERAGGDRRVCNTKFVESICPSLDIGSTLHEDRDRVEPDQVLVVLRVRLSAILRS